MNTRVGAEVVDRAREHVRCALAPGGWLIVGLYPLPSAPVSSLSAFRRSVKDSSDFRSFSGSGVLGHLVAVAKAGRQVPHLIAAGRDTNSYPIPRIISQPAITGVFGNSWGEKANE